jgi:glycosyltransferase involved in cell wall biosynthesis
MKFTIIHPSRSRPQKSAETIKKWIERSSGGVEVIVSLDEDDETVPLYKQHAIFDRILVSPNKTAIQAINTAAKHATGDVFVVVSDDTDCPRGWDLIISDVTIGRRDFVIKFGDGIQRRIITMPVLDRVYYNRDHRIYNPLYDHAWSDTEFTEVAHARHCVITRNDIVFRHLHYSVTGEQPDELYQRNDATHDPGRELYNQRKAINFGL